MDVVTQGEGLVVSASFPLILPSVVSTPKAEDNHKPHTD